MSSSFVADTTDDHKSDNTLIIIVNNDGSISVDQETLQNLLASQHSPQNTAVSVVRVGGQGDDSSQDSSGTSDSQNDGSPHLNLTVEGFLPGAADAEAAVAVAMGGVDASADTETTPAVSSPAVVNSVPPANPAEGESLDPFLEMDSEQLERLETALQSEQAKQILGENVTAMLDMLSVEEEASQLKDTIRMDHCYTSLSASAAPPTPPVSSAVPSHHYGAPASREDGGSILVDQSDHIQQVTPAGMGPPVTQTIRGRGRGRPGRPRRDMSSTRGVTYSAQRTITRGAANRGVKIQRSGTVMAGTGGNMIMVQQIKPINPPLAPPPSTPSSATLVPVVKPLVMTSGTAVTGQISTASIRTVPGQLQKQIITVPHGARLVTVSGNQPITTQTVLLTNSSGQVVQAQPIQTQTIQAQTIQTQPIQVAASISQVQAQNLNSAKVVVAKMPILPPQLLGAQQNTLPHSEQPTQHLQKEDESDFTDFPQEASEDSESEESDAGSDDEYKDPSVGRRGGRGTKGRGRFSRGGRSRGIHRMYEGGRGSRGGRRGRGRGFGRPEDADRAKKLEAEMAAVVAAMEKSPEGTHGEKTTPRDVQEKVLPKKEDVLALTAELSSGEGSKKKMMKVRGKLGKSISELSEETHVKVENTVIKEKGEKHVTSEKKSPSLKSPVRKQSGESLLTPVTTSAPTTPTTAAAVAGADRKNYPKRENRKPPAHLADALGPALFSTPDIIRRVSTGPDQKPNSVETPADEKKDPLKGAAEPTGAREKAHEVSETPDKGVKVTTVETSQPQVASSEMMQVSEAESSVLVSLQSEMKSEEQLLAEALLIQEQVNEDAKLPEIKKLLSPESAGVKGPELTETTVLEITQDPKSQILSQQGAGVLKQQGVSGTRSSRRRSSTSVHQNPGEPASKREANKPANAASKDKKREDKQKGRRLSLDVDDDDDEEQTSDDESWNSEDDPDRLWCICKKPHNNRFMICCDVCEDWFHGKCVGVTKAMGRQMENKGLEWSCPNCAKKKEEEKESKKHSSPAAPKEKEVKKMKESKKETHSEPPDEVNPALQDGKVMLVPGDGVAQPGGSSDAQILYCIVCKKLARPSSIYCSDACILKHAQESLNVLNKDKAVAAGAAAGAGSRDTEQQPQQLPPAVQPSNAKGPEAARLAGAGAGQLSKARPDARVIVFERKTGRLLAGPNAPTAGNLKTWLKDNPTFEVVRPGVLPATKFYGGKGQTKTVLLQSKVTPQKVNSLEPKVSLPLTTTSTAVVQTKQNTLKVNVTPQKTLVPHQKVIAVSTKTGTLGQKSVLNVSSKIVPAKTQKGPIIVAAQPQKVLVKGTAVKSPTTPTKTVAKQSLMTTANMKGQSSPNKASPTNMVSRAPATSTVKEASKAEKTVVKKVEVKRQSSSSSDSAKKEEEKEKPTGPEPIRLNVRKTLQELLEARIKLCPDLNLPEGEVQNIALNIEEEMHSYFREPGMKYKSKYRSLVFNIKDPKNLTLFRKIADKSVTPYQLVRLTPEELASQELAQWREREVKHQLEMIKKNELDLMAQAKTYVLKTHKGEQEIETDESLKVEVPELVDPATVPDLVSPVNNSVSSTVEDIELDKVKSKLKDKDSKEKSNKEEKDRGRDREKSKHDEKRRDKTERRKDEKERSHHDRHDRDKRKGSKDRDKKSSSKDKHRSSDKSKHDGDKHKDSKSSRKDKKDETELKKEEIKKEEFQEKEEEEKSEKVVVHEEHKDESGIHFKPKFELPFHAKSEPLEDSDLSDREPSSTVTIKTPDINVEDPERATVWKGFVNMPDVAKFFTSVQVVSGDAQNLYKDLPDTLDIVGRIIPDTVWEYIKKMKKTGTKEILVIRLNAANEEERIQYVTLYTYLNTRNRLGVVGNVSKMIKDFYIMPLASHHPVPDVLLPLDGPGFEDYRPHLLLGILVRARRKRLAPENEYVAKPPKRPVLPPPMPAEPTERSYTPPLPSMGGDDLGSLTPPHPPPAASKGSYTPPRSPQNFLPGPSHIVKNNDPRLSRKDSFQEDLTLGEKPPGVFKMEKPSLASHVGHYGLDDDDDDNDEDDDEDDNDDDAPYSPGGSEVESAEENLLLTPKNPSELQRKVEELNRRIEEQKQQIESISSAMVGSDPSVAALGTESLKSYMLASEDRQGEPEEEDENEAYSPSRSFTPPATIPFIGPAESGSAPVFSTLPSNINLPSNLHEILASIKKQENDKVVGSTSLKGINLKSDPIVQTYGKAADLDSGPPKTPTEDYSNSAASVSSSYSSASSGNAASPASSSILQSASSALLSLSTPVVHPLMATGGSVPAAKAAETKTRDPRQRGSEVITKPSGGSTLSTLSDDDLIKKALEMEMEMSEPKINTGVAVDQTTLQQPLPPGVDSMPAGTGPPLTPSLMVQSIPAGQPLPPGVEDEEYPSYSSSFGVPAAQSTLPPPMTVPMSPNYSMPTPTSPAPYCIPHHYTGPTYPAPGRTPPQAPGYSSTFVPSGGYSGSKSIDDGSNVPPAKIKRKFSDSEVDESGVIKRDRSDSPTGGGRDNWDNKMPVPVRGRFSGVRGRGFMRGSPSQRAFIRLRGGVSHNPSQNRSRWDNKDIDRKRPSHYEQNRSEWETHSKDLDEKLRDRPRERRRDRSRERDKSSSSQRSHSNGRSSSRNKESEKGSESS